MFDTIIGQQLIKSRAADAFSIIIVVIAAICLYVKVATLTYAYQFLVYAGAYPTAIVCIRWLIELAMRKYIAAKLYTIANTIYQHCRLCLDDETDTTFIFDATLQMLLYLSIDGKPVNISEDTDKIRKMAQKLNPLYDVGHIIGLSDEHLLIQSPVRKLKYGCDKCPVAKHCICSKYQKGEYLGELWEEIKLRTKQL